MSWIAIFSSLGIKKGHNYIFPRVTKNNQTVIANSACGVTSYRKQFLEVQLYASAGKMKAEYDLLTDIFSVLVYRISIPTPS